MMFSIIDDMDKRERDYSIDFVKGVAILFVILLHNMPNESIYSIAYIGQVVPLFLLVSSLFDLMVVFSEKVSTVISLLGMWKKMLDRVFSPILSLNFFSMCNLLSS